MSSKGRNRTIGQLSTSVVAFACAAGVAFATLIGFGGSPAGASASTKGLKGEVSFSGTREYIILYKKPVDLGTQLRREVQKGNEVERRYSSAVNGALLRLEDGDVNRLRKDERVAVLEPNGRVNIAATTDGTRNAASWGLDRVDQRNLPLNGTIATSREGAGVEAYIIDTGIRLDHTQFTGRVSSEGFSAFSGGWNDCNGHGTHVAGTVAGSTYGVAPAARVTAVKVLNCEGSGSFAGVIGGIDWVVSDHRAGDPAVANMSLGGGRSESVNLAVQRAIDDGVSMVVAAGNSRADACGFSPASAPNAVTVGSSTRTDSASNFSNQGRCVDIFAPGSDILSAWHTSPTAIDSLSGTSMASPHVAGVASLLLSGQPAMTPAQVTDQLVASASPSRLSGVTGGTANLLVYAGSGADLPPPPEEPCGPSNDDFADRQTLSSLPGVRGSSDCATREPSEPSHGSGSSASVWYAWTAPQNGTLTLQTDGSSFDTLLAAYSGSSLTSLSQLASDDDSGSGLTSRISFPVEGGRSYSVAVDGYGGATGDVQVTGSFTPASGGNPGDPGNPDQRPSNDDFESRTTIDLPSGITSSNLGATAESGEPAHHGSRAAQTSVWYRWSAPDDGTVILRTDGSSFDTLLAAYSGSSLTSLSQLASDDDSGSGLTSRISFPVVAGEVYSIVIDGYGGATGDARISGSFSDSAEPPVTRLPRPRFFSVPPRVTRSRVAFFRFRGRAGASFECRLDRSSWVPCSSPRRVGLLNRGRHVLRIRQVMDGIRSAPTRYRWRVVGNRR